MIAAFKQSIKCPSFWITFLGGSLVLALLYLVLFLNNAQAAANAGLKPFSKELEAIGFDLSDRDVGGCHQNKGPGSLHRGQCRSSEVKSTIEFDQATQVRFRQQVDRLKSKLANSGWKREVKTRAQAYDIELEELLNYVGPGETNHVAYHKGIGRSQCYFQLYTHDYTPTLWLQYGCFQKRTLFIF